MHSNSTLRSFGDPYKPVHDQIRRHRTVNKEQFSMLKPVSRKLPGVVRLLVQSDYCSHVISSEVLVVVFWGVQGIAPVEA